MTRDIIINCPHCEMLILIKETEINCAIFRHGAYKKDLKQINPHEKKEECDRLANENLIHGCSKPFRLIKENDEYKAQTCDYI
jgi:hypothetical protein